MAGNRAKPASADFGDGRTQFNIGIDSGFGILGISWDCHKAGANWILAKIKEISSDGRKKEARTAR